MRNFRLIIFAYQKSSAMMIHVWVIFPGTTTIPVIPPASKGGIPAQSFPGQQMFGLPGQQMAGLPGQQTMGLPGQPAPLPNFTQSPVLGTGGTGKLSFQDYSWIQDFEADFP